MVTLLPFQLYLNKCRQTLVEQLTISIYFRLMFRYDASEVEAPPPLQYDSTIDEKELTVDQWREALWEEVINWKPHPMSTAHPLSSSMEHSSS